MALDDAILFAIQYVCVPLWLLAGTGDWLCHRATRIEATSGLPESLFHLLLIAEMGVPMLAGLFLEIDAGVLALMIACFLLHEATVYLDLRYATGRRPIPPVEQIVHSFQELVPLTLLVLVALLHRDQFVALATLSPGAEFALRPKQVPLAPGYIAFVLAASLFCVALPFAEEFLRCLRAATQHNVTTK